MPTSLGTTKYISLQNTSENLQRERENNALIREWKIWDDEEEKWLGLFMVEVQGSKLQLSYAKSQSHFWCLKSQILIPISF